MDEVGWVAARELKAPEAGGGAELLRGLAGCGEGRWGVGEVPWRGGMQMVVQTDKVQKQVRGWHALVGVVGETRLWWGGCNGQGEAGGGRVEG